MLQPISARLASSCSRKGIKAAETLEKKYIYMAAYLDPHTRDQLTLDEIKNLCDDLIEAHGDWLPKFH